MAKTASWSSGLHFADDTTRRSMARAAAAGRLRRLAAGVYTGNLGDPLERVALGNLYEILEHERPGVVITDASAKTGQPIGGRLLVSSAKQQRDLDLPGLTVRVRRGPGPTDGDMALAAGVWLAGPARGLLDNLSTARGAASRTMPRADVERWLEELLGTRGESYLNSLRDQARRLAPELGRRREADTLDEMIAAMLGTRTDVVLTHPQAVARSEGRPVDAARIRMFEALASWLGDQPPNLLIDEPRFAPRRLLLPFYEAYFSNFIEGTEFTLDEAAEIALAGTVPADRPADAHDIAGTYRLSSDPAEMHRTPGGPGELMQLLHARHRVLLGGRPDLTPGVFKTRDNRAGSTTFVDWDKVEGTLGAGYAPYRQLADPFARAVYVMFLISEVHPYADGNGRVARLMMNAELVAAGQVRIIVPIVYRENFLAALRAASRTEHFGAVYRTMDFARRYTARVDFSSRASAESDLARTNALLDPVEAERNGVALQLP